MQGLAPIDGWALIAILAKATGYGTALLAIGGPLFLSIFRRLPPEVSDVARKVTIWACVIGLAILALRFGIRAGRLGGMGLRGMIDPMLLTIVWDSPLGGVAVLRAAGYGLTLVALLVRPLLPLGLIGAALIALASTQIGHVSALQSFYSNILILHLVMAGFWVAALIPLHRAVLFEGGVGVLRTFGWIAVAVVAILVVAGGILSAALIGGLWSGLGTAYAGVILVKLLCVAALVSLAAGNKFARVPALERGEVGARRRLQWAIRWEIGLVVFILVMTATVTTVTTPPINT